MNKEKAYNIFLEYVSKHFFKSAKVLSLRENENLYLFEFCNDKDVQPIDYPIVSINKNSGSVEELYFTNEKQRKIIYS